MRAESLQRRPPCSFEAFIAARTITRVTKKFFADSPCDDPRGLTFPVRVHVWPVAAVLDAGRFVAAAFCDRCRTAAIADGFSTATTVLPSAGIPHCSSAPSDASDESSFRIPSANTPGFVAGVILASAVDRYVGVDFSEKLTDLDWGSWEGSLPESSSLGGDGTPLRGAFIIDSGFGRDSRTHLRIQLYQL